MSTRAKKDYIKLENATIVKMLNFVSPERVVDTPDDALIWQILTIEPVSRIRSWGSCWLPKYSFVVIYRLK